MVTRLCSTHGVHVIYSPNDPSVVTVTGTPEDIHFLVEVLTLVHSTCSMGDQSDMES